MADVFTALVHYPVYNKNRDVVASALTTIDMHDLARLAATYGASGVYLVTPLEDQRRVAEQMIEHWCHGAGAVYNETRRRALDLVKLAGNVAEAVFDVTQACGRRPLIVGTSAQGGDRRISFSAMAETIRGPHPVLILFGTAWGLTEQALEECDLLMEPVRGAGDYNHLSVRAAAGIVMDRLLGRR